MSDDLDDLKKILARVVAGSRDETDIQVLVSAFQSGRIVQATGERAVAFGADATDVVVITGDNNFLCIFKATDAEVIKQFFQQPSDILHNLPDSGLLEFVGRSVEQVDQMLQKNNRIAITGMGGVGKTELALQYARRYKHKYSGGVCWVEAGETENNTQATDIAKQIIDFTKLFKLYIPENIEKPEEQVKFCWNYWQLGKVLLVIDDVISYSLIKPFLPLDEPRFKVLFTTREKLRSPFICLELDVLKPRAAINLLQSIIGRIRLNKEPWIVRQLCRWLGYLPLSLELVGRYLLLDEDFTLSDMLSSLEAERLEQYVLTEANEQMTAKRGVFAAFQLSWKRLDTESQKLGCLLSIFAQAPIPWKLIEDNKDWTKNRKPLVKLSQLNLLQRRKENIYQLHSLIREFFKKKLEESTFKNNLKFSFCEEMAKLARQIPESCDKNLLFDFSTKIPHIKSSTDLSEYLNDKDLIQPFEGIGRFYEGQGFYKDAESWYMQGYTLAKQRLGSEHLDIATCLHSIGLNYHNQGLYTNAESKIQEARELRKEILQNQDHRDMADSFEGLGNLYADQEEREEEAEDFLLKALEMRKRLVQENPVKENHLATGTCLNNLAYLYYQFGEYQQAISFFEEAIEIYKKFSEEKEVASTLTNLASVYIDIAQETDEEDQNQAELLLKQALDMQTKLLGEKHHETATTIFNLGSLYYDQGHFTEAKNCYEKSLKIRQELHGENHPDVSRSIGSLGNCYWKIDDSKEAKKLYVKALEIAKLLQSHEIINWLEGKLEIVNDSQEIN